MGNSKRNISNFSKCANCGACVNTCPTNAINVEKDKMYYNIIVDDTKCVECGKCISICPVNTPQNTQNLISAYFGYVDDDSVLYTSSSGGIFHALAKNILNQGGVVYGAAYSEDKHTVIFSSTDDVNLFSLQKSKYVESDIGNIFKKIRKNILSNRKVLFCGTPCQAAGLKRYLGREYDNLVICDFSCGGLPSHKMYDEYLNNLEKKFSSKVEFVDFRPKNFGWENHSIYVRFKNGKEYTKLALLDPYFRAFLRSLSKRDYCYECDFANNHTADIILADFWLYKKLSQMDNQNKGISLILTNTEKGEVIMKELAPSLVLESLSLDKGSYNIKNGHLDKQIVNRHLEFIDLVRKNNFIYAINKLEAVSFKHNWKTMIKQLIRRRRNEGSKKTWN